MIRIEFSNSGNFINDASRLIRRTKIYDRINYK